MRTKCSAHLGSAPWDISPVWNFFVQEISAPLPLIETYRKSTGQSLWQVPSHLQKGEGICFILLSVCTKRNCIWFIFLLQHISPEHSYVVPPYSLFFFFILYPANVNIFFTVLIYT
jgi:hypothetical protein